MLILQTIGKTTSALDHFVRQLSIVTLDLLMQDLKQITWFSIAAKKSYTCGSHLHIEIKTANFPFWYLWNIKIPLIVIS